jgi:acid stress-induced BolA-like protein IbaG/YrbA
MDQIAEKLNLLFTLRFPGSGVEIEETVPGLKIGGALISPKFVGMEQIDRQRLLWSVLKENLSKEELSHLGTFLTFNPYEVEVMQEMAA